MTELPRGDEKIGAVRSMFDRIAPRYDLVNRVMTLGMDVRWRRQTARALGLPRSAVVLDAACGTGVLCCALAAEGTVPIGIDMSWGMLSEARPCAPYVQADALRLPVESGSCDGFTCGFALRNVADLDRLFDEAARVVRRGGRIALLEVAEPRSGVPRALHRLYFRKVVPAIGGLMSDRDAYSYLPRSVDYLPPDDALLEMARSAGFVDLARRVLGLGAVQLITGTRSG